MIPLDVPVTLTRDGAVATVELSRPQAMNSLDTETKAALQRALREVADDDEVRAVVLTATGRAFCVGQDLREHVTALESGEADLAASVRDEYSPLVKLLLEMDKPVICAVNGVAAGAGAGLALACDLRLMAENASYSFAFPGIALSCDTGLSWILPRLVGLARAKELMFSPAPVKADAALALGLATEVVPAERLAERAAELAAQYAAGPTRSYGSIRRAMATATTTDLDTALAAEAQAMGATGATQDHRAAVQAFLAKERPTFTGR